MITACLPQIERNNLKILLIEDNLEDAELIEELLLEPNVIPSASVTKVTRLREAIGVLNQEVFDVILLDLSLPDSQGFDTLVRVTEYSPKIPIIVLTASNDRELAIQLIQAGAQDYLDKLNINSTILIRSLQFAIERKQNRETIRQMEELANFQQAILNSTNYAIIATTIDGKIHTFNTAAQQLLGYQAAEVIGIVTPATIHDPQEIRQRARELSQELGIAIEPGFEVFVAKARLGETDEREWTYIRKDGHRFPVLLSITAIRDTFGNITGYLGIAREIGERKQTKDEIHLLLAATQAISKFHNFQEALAAILALVCTTIGWDVAEAWIPSDNNQVLEYSSSWYASEPSLEEFLHHSQNITFALNIGLPGRIWSSQQPEWIEDVSIAENTLFLRSQLAEKCGLKASFGVPIVSHHKVLAVLVFFKRTKSAKEPHLVELVNAVATQLGSPIQYKQAEAALHFSEERLQMALEGSALGMWDWDIRTGKTYFDSQWKKMLGYEIWEIENHYQAWEQLLHPEDLPRVLQILNDHLQGYTDIYEVEFRMKSKFKNWKWILSQGKIFERDRLGNPVRMLGTNLDISDRKTAEEENLKLTLNLQEAQRIAHIGNWEFDVTNGTNAWSNELFRIFGCKPGNHLHLPNLSNKFIQKIENLFSKF